MSASVTAIVTGALVGAAVWLLFTLLGQRYPDLTAFAASPLMPKVSLGAGALVAFMLISRTLPATASTPSESVPAAGATRVPFVIPTTPPGARNVLVWESTYTKTLVSTRPILPAGTVNVPLGSFPRPLGDNGRGLHWFPTTAQSRQVVDTYVAELVAMHIKWLVFVQGLEDYELAANDYLVSALVKNGIMPVMRIEARVGEMDLGRLSQVIKRYRALGVPYFQLYNEPNLNREWKNGLAGSADTFASLWLEAATVVVSLDGWPGIAAMSPDGDLSDYDYLRLTLEAIGKRTPREILSRTWLSVHNYSGGLPQDFVGDDGGYGRYRRYAAISRAALGVVLPMIGTEGGPQPSEPGHPAPADPQTQARWIVEAYRSLAKREPYWLAYSPWLIGNQIGGGTDARWEGAAWYKAGDAEPVVKFAKELPLATRPRQPTQQSQKYKKKREPTPS